MRKIILFTVLVFCSQLALAQLSLSGLTIENLDKPIGIDIAQPRFSWKLNSDERDVNQTSYELQVKSGKQVVWNSGKVESDQSIFVKYSGTNLKSNTDYQWSIRVSDNHGNSSEWASSSFRTAFLDSKEWEAKWITSGIAADTVNGPASLFRKTFAAKSKLTKAVMHITARGIYEAEINGKRVGDAYLTPGWTSYNKHLQYQTYDVTDAISEGNNNAIGIRLGSGWYRTRLGWLNNQNIYGDKTAVLMQLVLTYSNGKKEVIITDNSWKTAESEVVYSELYNGETIDARKRLENWSKIGFMDANWKNAENIEFPLDYINSAVNESIKKHETLKPIRVLTSPNGDKILDFGQNMVGWVTAFLEGKAGQRIKLRHFEMLDKEGNPYYDNLRTANAESNFILSGKGKEFFEPHFTFYGFRYVTLEGLTTELKPEDFTAVALYSDMTPTGDFNCSNELVNQLQSNIQWGQKGNFLDVPTDCPQRDERLGWTGDAEVFSNTAAYNFNVNQFFAKWLKDISADQYENGAVPFVIPDVLRNTFFGRAEGAAGWSDASIIIPYNMYFAYGDKSILENQYKSMQAYMKYVVDTAGDFLWDTGFQFADWLSYRVDDSKGLIGQKSAVTDNYLVAQCFFAYNANLMAKTADALGKKEDAEKYRMIEAKVKKAFQKEFMTSSGRLISDTQTAYILALQFDMLPTELRTQAVDRLVKNIESYEYHLTTGFLGTPFLNPVLTRFGRNDVAYKLLLQDTYPSWLYPIKTHGATTIWERWDSMKADSTFQDPSMTSFNHYSYGAVGDWIYKNVTGINAAQPGYKSFVISPLPGGGLTHATGNLETNYGKITSSWRIENKELHMDVVVPPNTTATVHFPIADIESLKQDGVLLNLDSKDLIPSLSLGSGKYSFSMKYEIENN